METVQFDDDTLRGENNVSPRQASFIRIRTFLKPAHFFTPIRVFGAFHSREKRCGFGERSYWFRVDGRPIRVDGASIRLIVSRYPTPYYSYQ